MGSISFIAGTTRSFVGITFFGFAVLDQKLFDIFPDLHLFLYTSSC